MAADDDVHRLRDILVEEVSLVDRAANKRRFLLVKREGTMSELRSDGRGGLTRVRKGDDDPEETEKAKKKPAFPGAHAPFGAGGKKPAADDDDEEKRKAAPSDDDDDEDEEKRKAAAPDVAGKLSDIADDLNAIADKMGDDDEPSDVNMKKLLAAHKKLSGFADAYLKRTAKSSVEKIGRKMSASRLATYKEALATLQSLLSDLMDSPKKEKDHDPDPGDPQLAAPGWKPSNPSGAPANGTGIAAMKAVEKVLADVAVLVKSQQTKISRLEKGVTPSNALAVNGVNKSRGDDIAWPTDMNARPRGDKSVSFLDAD